DAGEHVAPLHRDLHQCIRAVAMHVREQLSRRQGLLQLSGVLERLQASDQGRERRREGRPVLWHRSEILSPRRVPLTPGTLEAAMQTRLRTMGRLYAQR